MIDDVMRILRTGNKNVAADFYCPDETWTHFVTAGALVSSVSVQTTQLVWLAFYCSVATPAQVGHCDVSKVKAPWENTRLMCEVTSLRGNLRKLASQRSCTRCTVSLLVCGRWRLFAFQMQPLFSDCLHNRE
jgi:hypothetical protein